MFIAAFSDFGTNLPGAGWPFQIRCTTVQGVVLVKEQPCGISVLAGTEREVARVSSDNTDEMDDKWPGHAC